MRDDHILNSTTVNDFQDSKSWGQCRDVTVILSCQTGLETNIRRVQVGFRRSFTPNSFLASMLPRTGWVGAPTTEFVPENGKP